MNDTSLCLNKGNNNLSVTTNISFSNLDSVHSIIHFGDGWKYYSPKGNFTQTHSYYAVGNYSVLLECTSINGCSDSAIKSMEVKTNPGLQVFLNPATPCEGDTIHFLVIDTNKLSTQGIWFSDKSIKNLPILNNRFSRLYPAGINNGYSFNTVSGYGCRDTLTNSIYVNPKPIADFDAIRTESNLNNIVFQFTNKSKYATRYAWTFGKYGSSNNVDETFSFPDTGFISTKLIAMSGSGCKDSITKRIAVFPDIEFYIPTAITPNGDGLNDYLMVGSQQFISQFNIEIFNRWGQLIYRSNDKTKPWSAENDGVYVLNISIQDIFYKWHYFKQTITVNK